MKNKKIIGSLVVVVFITMFFSGVASPTTSIQDNSPEISQGVISPDDLIPINFSINIDGNWSETVSKYSWASGSGSKVDPWVIEGIHVTNNDKTAHISIDKAETFIIRNVTVSNYAKPYGDPRFAGIYIGKGEGGLIDNVTIINASHGISLYEAKDSLKITNSRFIGSHNDSETGWGAAIMIRSEAKGVEIYNNTIFNYYSGIVVYDAEGISIENNTIETSFGWESDTGIYFDNVNDSSIINNSFYGCNFTKQNSETPKTSSGSSFPIGLTNSYNIEIYGNRFYDLNGNLIGDLIVVPQNYWIFIFSGVVIVAVIVVVVVVVLIKKKNK